MIVAGLVLLGVGGYQAYKGITRKFLEESKTEQMSERVEKAFTVLGVVGHLARAVVFALIGYFLIKAAIDYNPKKAVGLDGALRQLATGGLRAASLLGIVAAGLIALRARTRSPTRAIARCSARRIG